MKSGLTVRADNAVAVLESLRQLSGMDVLVGIPEDKAGREDGSPINNAELGYLHSTGATVEIDGTTVTLPPRPFLDMGIEDSKPRTTAHLKAAATAARYDQMEPAIIAEEIAADTDRLVRIIDALSEGDWGRSGTRDGREFTVEFLLRYLLHDVEHHWYDVS